MSGPLAGVCIVELTQIVMGPFATQLLAELGADIVKVEAPEGDAMRYVGPKKSPDMGPNFLHLNRGKRSVVLDLRQPAGREAMLAIVARSDVFLHSLRPQSIARLGLDYETAARVNPRIIHVGCFGYGQDGPYAARPAYDDLIQGAAGIGSLYARATGGEPRYAPVNLADRAVGVHTAMAICAALYERERSGVGQAVEVPMFETLVQFVLGDHLWGCTHVPPTGETGYVRLLTPERRPFRTRDGYLCVLIYSDKQWRSFFEAIGRTDLWRDDARFRDNDSRTVHVDAVYSYLAAVLREKTSAEWLEILERADIPVAPLNTVDELLDDPHLAAVGLFETVEHPTEGPVRRMRAPSAWSRTRPRRTADTPRLGEHTEQVLRELGYADADLERLSGAGVTRPRR
jgi:crotonobetainyl-CoA:carnitine CoA-transferase CaiB-like acyl-CoA transferase